MGSHRIGVGTAETRPVGRGIGFRGGFLTVDGSGGQEGESGERREREGSHSGIIEGGMPVRLLPASFQAS